MQKLPLGIQHFPTLCRENHLYVDKTALLPKLVKYGKYLFLKKYYESYLGGNKKVTLLAIGFIGRTLDVKAEEIQ